MSVRRCRRIMRERVGPRRDHVQRLARRIARRAGLDTVRADFNSPLGSQRAAGDGVGAPSSNARPGTRPRAAARADRAPPAAPDRRLSGAGEPVVRTHGRRRAVRDGAVSEAVARPRAGIRLLVQSTTSSGRSTTRACSTSGSTSTGRSSISFRRSSLTTPASRSCARTTPLWCVERDRVKALFPALQEGMEPSSLWFRHL
jgi:hypothetical protein